jgi:hypothetical protein
VRNQERAGAKEAGYASGAVRHTADFVYNTAEDFIPKNTLANITGLNPDGPAIIPPSHTKAGRSTISELANKTGMHESVFAAEGHVPNFAGGSGITSHRKGASGATTEAKTPEQIKKAAIEQRRNMTLADLNRQKASKYSPRQAKNERVKGDGTDHSIFALQDDASEVQKKWPEGKPYATIKEYYSKTPSERSGMLDDEKTVKKLAETSQAKIDVAYVEQMADVLSNSPDEQAANAAVTADTLVDKPPQYGVRGIAEGGAKAIGVMAKEKQNPIGLNRSNFKEYLEKASSPESSGAISYIDQATMLLSLAIDRKLEGLWKQEKIPHLNYATMDALTAADRNLQLDEIDLNLARGFAEGNSEYSAEGHVPNFAGGSGITSLLK